MVFLPVFFSFVLNWFHYDSRVLAYHQWYVYDSLATPVVKVTQLLKKCMKPNLSGSNHSIFYFLTNFCNYKYLLAHKS